MQTFRALGITGATPEIVEGIATTCRGIFEPDCRKRRCTTPGHPDKTPVLDPLAMGLIGQNGAEMPTRLEGEAAAQEGTRLLVCNQPSQTFRFVDVAAQPVPSLLDFLGAAVCRTSLNCQIPSPSTSDSVALQTLPAKGAAIGKCRSGW